MSEPANDLAFHIRQGRCAIFDDRIPILASVLGPPTRVWQHYEAGMFGPALDVLSFIQAAGVEAHWLLIGEGDRYREA